MKARDVQKKTSESTPRTKETKERTVLHSCGQEHFFLQFISSNLCHHFTILDIDEQVITTKQKCIQFLCI